MNDETNPLFRALDDAGERRDGDFVRALASLVESRELFFEPDVECGIRNSPDGEEYVNIDWGFAVRRKWLDDWINNAGGRGGDPHPARRSSHRWPRAGS